MSKRKAEKRNKFKKNRATDKRVVIGLGVFLILFFSFLQFSYDGDIKESQLITIKGQLNSELSKEYNGGSKKSSYWILSIKSQPIDFLIAGVSKWSFNSELFKKLESNQSDITVKVEKETYEKLIKKPTNAEIGIRYLESNNQKYFDLSDYNNNKKTDMKYSYVFLLFGIGTLIYGFAMKK